MLFLGFIEGKNKNEIAKDLGIKPSNLYASKYPYDAEEFATEEWLRELSNSVTLCGVPQYQKRNIQISIGFRNFERCDIMFLFQKFNYKHVHLGKSATNEDAERMLCNFISKGNRKIVTFDTETTGLNFMKDTPFLFIFGWIYENTNEPYKGKFIQ